MDDTFGAVAAGSTTLVSPSSSSCGSYNNNGINMGLNNFAHGLLRASSSSASTLLASELTSPSSTTAVGSGSGVFTCRICLKAFESASLLNVHYTHTHRDKPQYECEHCGLIFSIKRELATHRRIHSGEPLHACGQCGKVFGTKQLLKKHHVWHSGNRDYVCPKCGKAFYQKGHLTQHMMIHSGGRPHVCTLCGKTFIFKFDLNRHLKIHQERGQDVPAVAASSITPPVVSSSSVDYGESVSLGFKSASSLKLEASDALLSRYDGGLMASDVATLLASMTDDLEPRSSSTGDLKVFNEPSSRAVNGRANRKGFALSLDGNFNGDEGELG